MSPRALHVSGKLKRSIPLCYGAHKSLRKLAISIVRGGSNALIYIEWRLVCINGALRLDYSLRITFNNPFIMSRLSQRLSILSGFSSLTSNSSNEEETLTVTEQFLPRRQNSVYGDVYAFQKSVQTECIYARLFLLSPFPCDVPPFAKSAAYLSSHSGSIRAEIYRLSGAENHFFRLYIFACGSNVSLTLPPLFRGIVSIDNHGQLMKKKRVQCARSFCDRMKRGFIRFDALALENDDEIYVQGAGRVSLQLMPEDGHANTGWTRSNRMRRILNMI
ncbi:hypothetical protein BJ138DRAFT_81647 [Hygrophoropsis aurantiaca]|uniref:Uncharacterized protein n=1 Tax=Hygrophoropsis aurantiaca TaxID=72124 RepID=A0ACB8AAV9_9AGAM|nr:hypothetical protein BJ138DRAFT_81647 [Hygrophoropsis aurantiaca]